jgi:hypothetical protein
MAASIEVHEIRLTSSLASGGTDWPLTVRYPDGRELRIWPDGHGVTVRMPKWGLADSFEEVDITLPVLGDLAREEGRCDGETGRFRVDAQHRH